MRNSTKLAFSGVISALALAIMWLGNFDISTFFLPTVAGMAISIVYLEIDGKSAWSSFLTVSLLSLILTQQREVLFLFIFFYGYYPILKLILEKKLLNSQIKKITVTIIKFIVFNIGTVLTYTMYFFMFGLDPDMFTIFGVSLPWLFLILNNLIFILYDVLLNQFFAIYKSRLHKHVARYIRKK